MNATARLLLLAFTLPLAAGCASTADRTNVDPFEKVNRVVFAVNDGIDQVVIAPVSRGYQAITPGFMQRGVRNFFVNLYDLNGAVNAALQGRIGDSARNSGRFLVNSTVGMFGLVDVASGMNLQPYRTDFGHTLAVWGLDSGPYLMVPLLGPRTLRSGTGTLFDAVVSVQWQLDTTTRNALFGLEIIDNRAAIAPAEDLVTGDRYIFVRDAYLQQREYFINGGVVQDNFSDFEDDFEWED